MSGALVAGLLLGLASAAAIGGGFALQHGVASSLEPLSGRRPLRSLLRLARRPRWLGGITLGLGGWAAYVAALRLAPLSLVQAASAAGIVVLVLVEGRPGRRERAGTAAALVGLLLLGLSLHGPGSGAGATPVVVAVWLAVSLGAAALAASPAAARLAPGAGLAAAAGILYAAGDVATKEAVAGSPLFVPAVLACSGLAFAALQLAFQRGGPLATAGLATLLMNALPIVAGTTLYAEPFPGGWRGAARVAAFCLLVAAGAALARTDEPAAGASLTGSSEPTYTLTTVS